MCARPGREDFALFSPIPVTHSALQRQLWLVGAVKSPAIEKRKT